MSFGVQINNAGGIKMLDTTYRISRFITTFVVTSNGSYVVPDSAGPGVVIAFVTNAGGDVTPVITVSGRTVSWSFPSTYGYAYNSLGYKIHVEII